jgi:hypothetical protein
MPSSWETFACGTEYTHYAGIEQGEWRTVVRYGERRSQMTWVKQGPTQELQNVLFRFKDFDYGRREFTERNPEDVEFRGQPRFWCGEDIAFAVPIEIGREYTISEADFEVPSYAYEYTHGEEEMEENHAADAALTQPKGDWFRFEGLSNEVLQVLLTPDFDHDRRIDDLDRVNQAKHGLYHFWINDDDDQSADTGDDRPGAGPDAGNQHVDSVRDLVDFFPVAIDVGSLLQSFAWSNIEIRVKQDDGALKLLETDMTAGRAGDYLTELDIADDLDSAVVRTVTPQGTALGAAFVERMSVQGAGVILLEASESTTKPLVVEVRLRDADQELCRAELPLSIAGVEAMFDHKNLRAAGNGSVGVYDREASNLPDELCNGKHFVFLHGYSVSEQDARGWQSEVFKRMYWSGSNARFHGVTWRGDETRGGIPFLDELTPNYHVNVIHAMDSADELANYLATLPGEVVLAAHSLGNMVASTSIQDYGAHATKYFMIDAAVAMEAYDSAAVNTQAMVHCAWADYQDRLWASEWHELFDPPDGRRALTWRGRFASVVPKAYNFYSSGEDVLDAHVGCPSLLSGVWNKSRYAWCMQEKLKGRLDMVPYQSAVYGGWDFNGDYWVGVLDPEQGAYLYGRTPAEAAGIPNSVLRRYPLFNRGLSVNSTDLYDEAAGSAYAAAHDHRLLAEMFPAMSLPAGANFVPAIQLGGGKNSDINSSAFRTGWPSSGGNGDWQHSDFKNVAFTYVNPLFDTFVGEGGLK